MKKKYIQINNNNKKKKYKNLNNKQKKILNKILIED